ncbi:MAG TPA: hypothetical protein VIG64_04635 [Actinomycetota bacterium]
MMTTDLDIVPASGTSNLEALATALNSLNARLITGDPDGLKIDFTAKQLQKWIVEFRFLNLTTDHGQLDIVYRPGGTAGYQDLIRAAETLEIGPIQVRVASLEDIIRSKQAVGRDRDLEQLPTLRLVLEQKRSGIRPGQLVRIPWGLEQPRTGMVLAVRGFGPAARASVRVHLDDGEEELDFPVSILEPANG